MRRDHGGQIVVGVDGSPGSVTALRWAIDEARLRDDALAVVGTWTDPLALGGPGLPVGVGANIRKGTKRSLEEAVAGAAGTEALDVDVRPAVICGRAAEALCQVSEDADLLVLGSRGLGGVKGMLLGSVSQQCVHHARCPVVIVHGLRSGTAGSGQPMQPRIVVGVDGSAPSYLAMEWAVSEARLRGATLELVHAWRDPFATFAAVDEDLREEATEILAEAHKEALSMDGTIDTTSHLVEARTAPALLDASKGADLLVVGSRGRGGFAGLLLGSVSLACATNASSAVAVVRAQDV